MWTGLLVYPVSKELGISRVVLSSMEVVSYHNFGHYSSSCLLFQTQLNSVGLSLRHRKHITFPLLAQQILFPVGMLLSGSYGLVSVGHPL
jgi:hypothetical protein